MLIFQSRRNSNVKKIWEKSKLPIKIKINSKPIVYQPNSFSNIDIDLSTMISSYLTIQLLQKLIHI